jgi:thioredoxin
MSTTNIDTAKLLDEVMGPEGGPALIDFWAPWCGPCRMMGPHYEAISETYADYPVAFYKLNTEDHPELSRRFRVRSIPTVLLIHEGEILDVLVGVSDQRRLGKKVNWLLKKAGHASPEAEGGLLSRIGRRLRG